MPDFPGNFLWGASTAAHQVEGNNTNSNWWAFEHAEGTPVEEPSGDAIDHWHRYDSDYSLLAALGQNAHRFSFEWARIEPAPGEFSHAALDHYKRVLESLHRHGLTPFATLYHFSLPQWFADRGGWTSPEALERFGAYAERVVSELGDLVPYFGTINEPQIVAAMGYLAASHAPGVYDLEKAVLVNNTLAAAHHVAVAAVRTRGGRSQVGTCLQIPYVEVRDPSSEADVAVYERVKAFMVDTHLDDLRAAADPGDFLGLQYYSRDLVDEHSLTNRTPLPEDVEKTMMGWEVYPAGLGHVLRQVSQVGLPVIVTENGIATLDDHQRVRYLASHLQELKSALDDGVDIRGYFHWSAFDNYEWGSYAPRFGLIGIDRDNGLRREVRRSAVLYGEVARTGDLTALVRAASA